MTPEKLRQRRREQDFKAYRNMAPASILPDHFMRDYGDGSIDCTLFGIQIEKLSEVELRAALRFSIKQAHKRREINHRANDISSD